MYSTCSPSSGTMSIWSCTPAILQYHIHTHSHGNRYSTKKHARKHTTQSPYSETYRTLKLRINVLVRKPGHLYILHSLRNLQKTSSLQVCKWRLWVRPLLHFPVKTDNVFKTNTFIDPKTLEVFEIGVFAMDRKHWWEEKHLELCR